MKRSLGPLSRPTEHVLLLLCVGLAAAIPLRNGWYKWPDAYVDFGREAYLAWRVVEGDVLQRDVRHMFGPLTTYFNAAMFGVFGTSLGTLYFVNGVLYFVLVSSLFRILRRFTGFAASLLACTWVTAALAFNQLVDIGNYNFMAPYAHEVTHGLVLSAVALLLTVKMLEIPGSRRLAALAGAAFGAAALTKPEIFLALSLAVGLLLLLRRSDWSPRSLLLFLGGALVLPATFGVFFLVYGGWRLCADNILAPFSALLGVLHHRDVAAFPLYRYALGTDHLERRIARSLHAFALISGPLLLAWLTERCLSGRISSGPLRWLVRGSFGVVGFLAMYFAPRFFMLPTATPWALVLASGYFLWLWRKGRSREATVALATAALGGGILLKTMLNVRYEHYGFALDFFAFAFLLATAWDTAKAYGLFLRPLLLGAVLAVAIKIPALSQEAFWQRKTEVVAIGPDKLLTYAGDRSLADTAAMVGRRVPPDATLSVWPEGSMLNYLTRRRSSVGETVFLPFTFGVRGEDGALKELKESPPDFVILRNRDVAEFGKIGFGVDYGTSLFAWLEANYVKRDQYGVVPFVPGETGMIFYERAGR